MSSQRVPLTSVSAEKRHQLNSSTIIPAMYVYLEKYDLDATVGAIVYEIEVGIQIQGDVHVTRVKRRYSALFEFDRQIRPMFQDSRFLQTFPPKKLFGNKDAQFLKERATGIQAYVSDLVRVSGITDTPAFRRVFALDMDVLNSV